MTRFADTIDRISVLLSSSHAIQMYKNRFSLHRLPFSAAPDISGYFAAESIETARCAVMQVLENGTGIPLVFGEAGMGKSLLLRVLENSLENECHVVYMANQRLRKPKSLYQHLLFSLHQSYCGMDENELRLMFLDTLRQAEMRRIVLLVDEAQSLGRTTLEELRVLLHYNHNENSVSIRLVLAGDHRFEERLTHPHLAAFQQQVVARCYLERFRWDETDAEILWQLKQAGCETPASLFLPEARKTVHKLAEGVPRIVHQLCQQALIYAAESDLTCVDEAVVQTAWHVLQQLPSHGNIFPSSSTTISANVSTHDGSSVIEFGTLDDDEPVLPSLCVPPMPDGLDESLPVLPSDEWEANPDDGETKYESTSCFPSQKFELATLGDVLSDKTVLRKKQQEIQQHESFLDELSGIENWLTEQNSVIKKMKKIDGDCLTRPGRHASPTDILACFPEIAKKSK